MKTKLYWCALVVMFIAMSCHSDHEVVIPEVTVDSGKDKIEQRNKNRFVYAYQTDRYNLINSFIKYDKAKENYFFDLSSADAASLGISEEDIHQAEMLVQRMNSIKQERVH